MSETTAPPTLAAVEDLGRRYGLLLRGAIVALVAATIWVTTVTSRLSRLEVQMETVVERLDPVRDALIRIQTRLGIEQPKADK